jgi:hypothetical protein
VKGAEPLYRLITTLLDEKAAPAAELAALYEERWEIETALDEFKTHLRGSQIVLRSRTPELVRQEFYGLLLAHFAVRKLMHEAAHQAELDPDDLSFVHAVRVIRRKLLPHVITPPKHRKNFRQSVLEELLEERVPNRQGRRNIRAVKRKACKCPIKPQRSAEIQPPLDRETHAYIRIRAAK